MIKTAALLIATLALASCAVKPATWGNAVRGHAALPALSVAILECTASRPDVQASIEKPFNTLVDAWHEARMYEPNQELLIAMANSPAKLRSYKAAWLTAKNAVLDSGLDCGVWVRTEVQNIETTFEALTEALDDNASAVLVLDYLQVFAAIFTGRQIDVQRMPHA